MKEITTVEELDALPFGAVVLDAGGDVWQKRYGGDDEDPWAMAGYHSEPETSKNVCRFAPLRLLWTPDSQPEPSAEHADASRDMDRAERMLDGEAANNG